MMGKVANNVQAPLSSKGANAPNFATPAVKELSVNLDWCRFTVPYDQELKQGDNLLRAIPQHAAFKLTGEMLPNGKGYDSAMQLTIGVIHWHTKLPTQGLSVELSGSSLSQARKLGVEDIVILRHVEAMLGHVSTLDSAIDVYNHDADFRDILMLDDLGSLETTVRDVYGYQGRTRTKKNITTEGTAYIGSAKSPKQIKVYDKAAEQGTPDKDWTRIEMRWRGKHARAAHIAMLKFGVAAVTQKAIKAMCNADIEWWQEAVTGSIAEIEPTRRPDTNTVDWLINLTAPVLERELSKERAEGGTRLFETFSGILIAETQQRGNKGYQGRSNSAKIRGMR